MVDDRGEARNWLDDDGTPPPASLWFLLEDVELPEAPGRQGGGLTDRERVLQSLGLKMRKLDKCERALDVILDAGTSPDPRATRLLLAETVSERSLCSARFSAIDRGEPFREMSREAELALLASIKEVTRALANTAAVVALLAAVHGLVKSYAAGDT